LTINDLRAETSWARLVELAPAPILWLIVPDDLTIKGDLSPLPRGQRDGVLEAIVRTRETSNIARVGDPNRVHIIKHISHNKNQYIRISAKVKNYFSDS
jgi:hypothetical protein